MLKIMRDNDLSPVLLSPVLHFYDVEVFYRELHFGTAEIVDVDGKIDEMTRDRYVS